jgi:N-acetylglucosaminyl-diphospho-decaprenol L-rhamnosyltransferase
MDGVDVSVVIPHWNTPDLLLECVSALLHGRGRLRYDIHVIDNGSDQPRRPPPSLPPVRSVVLNSANRGFAAACNQGALLARGRFVLFLNSDARVADDCVARLVAAMESERDLVAIAPVERNGKSLPVSPARRWLAPWTQACALLGWGSARRLLSAPVVPIVRVAWVQAAALLVDAARFRALGGFDEGFYFYEEDEDFCWRAWRRGYATGVCRDAEIDHSGGLSTSLAANWPALALAAGQRRFVQRRFGAAGGLAHDVSVRGARAAKRLRSGFVLGGKGCCRALPKAPTTPARSGASTTATAGR